MFAPTFHTDVPIYCLFFTIILLSCYNKLITYFQIKTRKSCLSFLNQKKCILYYVRNVFRSLRRVLFFLSFVLPLFLRLYSSDSEIYYSILLQITPERKRNYFATYVLRPITSYGILNISASIQIFYFIGNYD
jgi:hypothetical protein